MQEKHPKSDIQIRFQDCDAFGHLNNARYIDYFLNAREDHLRDHYGLDLAEVARTHQANWFVMKHQIAYLRPAYPGETVTVQTGLIDVDGNTLTVEGTMWDAEQRTLKAIQWTTFRYVKLSTGRPAPHPNDISELLDTVLIDDVRTDSIDGRVREIKTSARAIA